MPVYLFKSKDRRIKGMIEAKNEEAVIAFADYPQKELIIKVTRWDIEKKPLVTVKHRKIPPEN